MVRKKEENYTRSKRERSKKEESSKKPKRSNIVLLLSSLILLILLFLFFKGMSSSLEGIEFEDNLKINTEPSFGEVDAPVKIIEYFDFQCPSCSAYFLEDFSRIKKEYIETGKVRYIFKDFIVNEKSISPVIAVYANCAHEQGKYLAFIESLYLSKEKLDQESIHKSINNTNLNKTLMEKCVREGTYGAEIMTDTEEALMRGFRGTPSFIINNQEYHGRLEYEEMSDIINKELR